MEEEVEVESEMVKLDFPERDVDISGSPPGAGAAVLGFLDPALRFLPAFRGLTGISNLDDMISKTFGTGPTLCA